MPPKKIPKKKNNRTKRIDILPQESGNVEPAGAASKDASPLLKVTKQQQAGESFHLNVDVPHAAHEVLKNKPKSNASSQAPGETAAAPAGAHQPSPRAMMSRKIWNTLEWIATSALIFAVLFFIMNFNAYSTLLLNKLDKLRGDIRTNPVVQNLTTSLGATQQPLPIATTSDQSKKQIPYLNIEVAPPDDRVIIPRINKNVPVVRVSTENLIKRDWGALEAEIQQALKYGVVHYPGTAEAGENGNVVITGHSSYFSWDPGRFKDVFALLHEVVVGDTIIVYHNQKKYFYQVYETQVVTPDKIDILTQRGENRLTLITCTPVGTNLKRLVVFARPSGQQ
jgi:LPXTG-site transpeptidase (sortase) family protein